MKGISLDFSHSGITMEQIKSMQNEISSAHKQLHIDAEDTENKAGWLNLPNKFMDTEEFDRIKQTAEYIKQNCDVFIVIGIGGSYLGAKAAIEALGHGFYNELSKDKRKTPKIYFAGNGLSGKYMTQLMEMIEGQDICINVISKSGTTTEPSISFRILKQYIEKKYGVENAKNRIYVTTDEKDGALRNLADTMGYTSFIIPKNVGGRYSVLTPVGLLPIAVAGIDIDLLVSGANDAFKAFVDDDVEDNVCYQYAALRHILYDAGKKNEILVTYEPSFSWLLEWWKQLYGESDGKENRGIFPSSALFSADLHSMGQYIQQGERHIFETVLFIDEQVEDVIIPEDEFGLDGLDYLAGKNMNYVNEKAFEGTVMAHEEGDVPNIIIRLSKQDAYHYGALLYFFEKSCAMGGYVAGIDPFNQPGVEAYKSHMFKLLGKPE